MLKIGCHLSSSLGYLNMLQEAISIGANTFQFFTRNPRGGTAKPIDLIDIQNYIKDAETNNVKYIVAHAPYTMNLCSKDASIRKFALDVFQDDLKRLDHLPYVFYNFHPGSHVEQGVEVGTQMIIDALNQTLKEEQHTMVLLETMAGKGSEIGRNFEEIKTIMDGVVVKSKIGVLLDTCHVHEAGYDIINHLDEVLEQFDKIIGLEHLKAIHLNDSKNEIGAHKDRHEKIGEGKIGLETLVKIINHPKLRDLPFILETPNELPGYQHEIELLRKNYHE